MTSTKTADLLLRLSDFREGNDTLADREARLRAEAARLGWTVARVVIENDVNADGETMKPASAFKRKRIVTPSGRVELRTVRPAFREVLDDLAAGRVAAVLAEDLDRAARDPRDLEDLLDAVAAHNGSARSLSGSLTLTDGGTDSEVTMARVMVTMANKSSRDTSRRVAGGRSRTAQAGHFGGGRRPFGYRPDPFAPEHAKTLIVVPAEAAELRAAASAVLAGVSLRAIARDLRDRQVPTVTGAAWTPDTIRGILLAPVIAGLAAHTAAAAKDDPRKRTTAELHTATWTAILDRDVWQAVTDKLTDPSRLTSPGNEPRWLVSGIARCHCGEAVYARSASGRPSYVCRGPQAHLRRVAPATDEHVAAHIVARLSRPDAADLLRPAPRPGCDAPALRAERDRLNLRRAALVRMSVAGDLDDSDLAAGVREIKRRTAEIDATLTANSAPDPLAELRTDDVAAAWDALSLPRKRAVVRLLCDVTLLPGRPGAPRRFDPSTVAVTPKAA